MRLVLTGRQDGDREELDELTLQLRERLLELDVDDVRRVSDGPAPEGTRAFDAVTADALLVAFTHSLQASTAIVTLVRTWLDRAPRDRTVELTIGDRTLRLGNASSDQQDRLVEEFLAAVRDADADHGDETVTR
jgi:hypothetical protein